MPSIANPRAALARAPGRSNASHREIDGVRPRAHQLADLPRALIVGGVERADQRRADRRVAVRAHDRDQLRGQRRLGAAQGADHVVGARGDRRLAEARQRARGAHADPGVVVAQAHRQRGGRAGRVAADQAQPERGVGAHHRAGIGEPRHQPGDAGGGERVLLPREVGLGQRALLEAVDRERRQRAFGPGVDRGDRPGHRRAHPGVAAAGRGAERGQHRAGAGLAERGEPERRQPERRVDPHVDRGAGERVAEPARPVGEAPDQRRDPRAVRLARDVEAVDQRPGRRGALLGEPGLGRGDHRRIGIAERARQRRGRHHAGPGERRERGHALDPDGGIGVAGRHRQRGRTVGGPLQREHAHRVQADLDPRIVERGQQLVEPRAGRGRAQLVGRERARHERRDPGRHGLAGLRRRRGPAARDVRRQRRQRAGADIGHAVLGRDPVHGLDRADRLEVRELADAADRVQPDQRPLVARGGLQQVQAAHAAPRTALDHRVRRAAIRGVEHADQLGVGLTDQLGEHPDDGVDDLRPRAVERRRDRHQVLALGAPELEQRLGGRLRHHRLAVAQERQQVAPGVAQRRQPERRIGADDRAPVPQREHQILCDQLGLALHQLGVRQTCDGRLRSRIRSRHDIAPL